MDNEAAEEALRQDNLGRNDEEGELGGLLGRWSLGTVIVLVLIGLASGGALAYFLAIKK